ncbi:MAG: hypothetical protein A3E26_02430 [Chlamydiae bacterium RIFCSPHIGHO2_12_FULL_49_32]|nr:MAG: hypothetical protein A3D18_05060 [Chlamydiae bacterium RIFCSPHIGHO2_02_FULL_49_29]OGN63694.1 MAG: hypothetical protein A3E26_02430 [Chlamydiae bacterium RIFCSPHIGHO2_12_FULL_49_32]
MSSGKVIGKNAAFQKRTKFILNKLRDHCLQHEFQAKFRVPFVRFGKEWFFPVLLDGKQRE